MVRITEGRSVCEARSYRQRGPGETALSRHFARPMETNKNDDRSVGQFQDMEFPSRQRGRQGCFRQEVCDQGLAEKQRTHHGLLAGSSRITLSWASRKNGIHYLPMFGQYADALALFSRRCGENPLAGVLADPQLSTQHVATKLIHPAPTVLTTLISEGRRFISPPSSFAGIPCSHSF